MWTPSSLFLLRSSNNEEIIFRDCKRQLVAFKRDLFPEKIVMAIVDLVTIYDER